MSVKRSFAAAAVLCAWVVAGSGCVATPEMDAAKRAGLGPADFPEAGEDLFRGMDGGIALSPEEVKGRNTWMIWTAGNDGFWDHLANNSFGSVDLLKTLDSRRRGERFRYYGLMNEPGFRQAAAPDRHGLWLDEPEGPQPPAVDPRVYGRSSGVLGLRLFDNPAFDQAARAAWNPDRYYRDPDYYLNPKLVRPYRVGMACAFCHVGPDPVRPPADPERPRWENLSAYVGSQYFWIGRIFLHDLKPDNFAWQLFNTSAPGALDTSLIATDNNNNPRTMNAIYEVGARLTVAVPEEIRGGAQPRMPVPHVLKDGADSVGILAALGRVYVNIGSYHEEWLRHFKLLIGGQSQTPLDAASARQNSVYWLATEARLQHLAAYFLKAARPHRLEDAPGGRAYLTGDAEALTRGKLVFADRCASCHSSKQAPAGVPRDSAEHREWMRREALKPDFRDGNFFSTDARIPVSEVKTNACAALATNAAPGSHLGQLLLGDLQDAAGGRVDPGPAPAGLHRQHLRDARGRSRLLSRAVAGQRLGLGALLPQQRARPLHQRPVGGGPDGGVRRRGGEAALARQAPGRRLRAPVGPPVLPAHLPDDAGQLPDREPGLPAGHPAARAARARRAGAADRPHPEGDAGQSRGQPEQRALARAGPARPAGGGGAQGQERAAPDQGREHHRRGRAEPHPPRPGAGLPVGEQVPRLRGRSGARVRRRPAGRRQARADRVPQDALRRP